MESTASECVLAPIPRERLLRAGDAGYDEASQVWNGMISHRPAAIALVESEDDVVAALAIARDEGLPVSIRGGGHNVAGLAVGDERGSSWTSPRWRGSLLIRRLAARPCRAARRGSLSTRRHRLSAWSRPAASSARPASRASL